MNKEIMEYLLFLIKPLFNKGVGIVWENRSALVLLLKTKFWKFRNKEIRFSISYLYKIQIPESNKYLLVFNRRIKNQLQPVGGAYKRYGDDSLFNKWLYKEDSSRNGLDVDKDSFKDLRFMVKGKYVLDVIKWFESGKEREVDTRREFREELIRTNILDSTIFEEISYKNIRRYSKNLSWSNHFSCYEILIFDIVEFIPNNEQAEALKALAKQKNTISKGFAIVDSDSIEQLRLLEGGIQIANIGQHTKLIINKNF